MTLIRVRKLIVLAAVALLVFAGAVLVGASLRGISPTELVALGLAVAATVGLRNVSVLILPYDLRKGRQPSLETSAVDWYPRLLDALEAAVGTR